MKRSSSLDQSPRDAFAIVLAIAVGVLVWFSRQFFDFLTPPQSDLSVPSLIGLTEEDARTAVNREHLDTVVIARRASDRFPAGVVVSQDPLAEANVRPGRRISVVVSSGLNLVSMPDLRYRSQREVSLILSRLHLHMAKSKLVDNDVIDAGHVVEQDPLPLTQVREGDSVNVSISRGQPSTVQVSDFIGLQIDDARLLATSQKLRMGQIVWTPFGAGGPPRGVVVRQKPASGSLIDPRQFVSLQVSAGPNQFGYLVREIHAAVTVPLEAQSAQLRVVAVDSMGSRPVYEGFGTAGERLDLVTTTVGPAELDTYLNNELIDTTTVAKEPKIQPERTAPQGSHTTITPDQLVPSPKSTMKTKEHQ